ncbi:MAG: type VI secretion system baseplate subunit TssK [Gammaproteobacteria bacterium]|nr:type VI secretion system baseplate subunit TssK [Gammaproteobacteria bacterium]
MIKVLDIVDAIQWHEGMLLAPQHFQQQSLRQEQLLHHAMQTVSPFGWGIRNIKIDPVQLMNGWFRVLELEAIMPDGLAVAHNAMEEDELSLDLTPHIENIKKCAMKVYLAVPVYSRSALGNVRYKSVEGAEVADVNTGEGAVSVPSLKPRLNLLIDQTPPARFTWFPLAQVIYKNETLAMSEFIPSTLIVDLRSPVGDLVNELVAEVRKKALFLSERLRSPAHAIRTDKPMQYDTQNILQGLVMALPQLEAMLYGGASHPYSLYLNLCSLAGSMAAFAGAVVPPVFPPYNHNDILSSFVPVRDFTREILEHIHEAYLIVPFHYKDLEFFLMPEPIWVARDFVIGVRGHAETSEEELENWVESCIICSSDKIASMHEKRILGARRTRIDKDEELDLIATRGIILLRVGADAEFIEPGRPLHIVNVQENVRQPAEIVFYVKL